VTGHWRPRRERDRDRHNGNRNETEDSDEYAKASAPAWAYHFEAAHVGDYWPERRKTAGTVRKMIRRSIHRDHWSI
jgi:hypothetical protein